MTDAGIYGLVYFTAVVLGLGFVCGAVATFLITR